MNPITLLALGAAAVGGYLVFRPKPSSKPKKKKGGGSFTDGSQAGGGGANVSPMPRDGVSFAPVVATAQYPMGGNALDVPVPFQAMDGSQIGDPKFAFAYTSGPLRNTGVYLYAGANDVVAPEDVVLVDVMQTPVTQGTQEVALILHSRTSPTTIVLQGIDILSLDNDYVPGGMRAGDIIPAGMKLGKVLEDKRLGFSMFSGSLLPKPELLAWGAWAPPPAGLLDPTKYLLDAHYRARKAAGI